MSRKVIELVQVLVDRIEKNGYQQRAREENAFDLNKRLTEAEGWVAHWKQARQEAHEAGELMKAEIETLRKELDEERSVNAGLREQLDAAHADYELAQAGTLLHQLDAANAAVSLQRAGIERLQAFVAKARQTIGRTMNFCDVEFLLNALAELDAGTEPTPRSNGRINPRSIRERHRPAPNRHPTGSGCVPARSVQAAEHNPPAVFVDHYARSSGLRRGYGLFRV
jgi:hypothetical protein